MFGIFDCEGNQVGNLQGYKTIRAADAIARRRKGKAHQQIWATFDSNQERLDATGYPKSGRLIYQIKPL